MRKVLALGLFIISTLLLISQVLAAPTWDKNPKGFEHGIVLEIDGEYYYFKGPGSIPGVTDVPGHTWVQTGPYQVEGRHYNIGPAGAPSWWAAGEPDRVLLYQVHGIVAPTELPYETEQKLKKQGYVHRHELLYATGPMKGMENTNIKVYLKHTAVRSFWFTHMVNRHVTPGIDFNFMPNW